MNAPPQSVPRPPADIWAEMEAAGRDGDTLRLGLARSRYTAWLADLGYLDPGPHGNTAPDRAYLPEPDEDDQT